MSKALRRICCVISRGSFKSSARSPDPRSARLARPSPLCGMLHKMEDVIVELDWVLQKGKVADLGLQQQTAAGDPARHEFGIVPLDGLVVVGVDDPDRHGYAVQLLRS